ncbi:RNA-binding protein [Pseudotabrizicola sediminis]|uniref:RNA-binding protein n=1 Tax=Pseudotabrizicola sediminis TaxID=2486418 RepID=A0ABY2KPW5_9RHOB|nr:RNA-binding protein [Pseudotabrizicola sediminis]TGD43200.1 RNA-binding protein [Pseudotabrizicola sediminis]TGD67176.1 RNA-binding protein [Tabrizicola sp. WMC-M-20]
MTRGGQKTSPDDPERKCIVSGESQPKAGLIRFVLGPEDMIVPDILARLPGRGIYVAADRDALTKAVKKNLFSRAARQPVKVADDLPDLVERLLVQRVIDLISLGRKAGDAICGYEKVKDWLIKGQARTLIQASDGSERGKEKLRPPNGPESLISCLTAGEMGLAFSRERAIHAALAAGGLNNRVVEEAARLVGLRRADGKQVGDEIAGKDTKDA